MSSGGNLFAQLYTYAWFVGFLVAGLLYWLLSRQPAAASTAA